MNLQFIFGNYSLILRLVRIGLAECIRFTDLLKQPPDWLSSLVYWPVRRDCAIDYNGTLALALALVCIGGITLAERSEAKVIPPMQTKTKAKAKCAVGRDVGI